MKKVANTNNLSKRNIALFLTAPEVAAAKARKQNNHNEKKYGLPDGFKLIGFNVVN